MIVVFINILYLCVAIFTLFGVLRILDRRMGVSFREKIYPIIMRDPLATAIYRAAWVIGVCVLAGSMLGTGL